MFFYNRIGSSEPFVSQNLIHINSFFWVDHQHALEQVDQLFHSYILLGIQKVHALFQIFTSPKLLVFSSIEILKDLIIFHSTFRIRGPQEKGRKKSNSQSKDISFFFVEVLAIRRGGQKPKDLWGQIFVGAIFP